MDGKKCPLAIGHRGASGHATENTLTAFAKASDLGAEMWELDTQLTVDGVCVVSHDDHLQRVFGLDLRISELTAAELATLEGACVPTFAAVAALARERNAGLYVELKAAGTGAIVWHELLRHMVSALPRSAPSTWPTCARCAMRAAAIRSRYSCG